MLISVAATAIRAILLNDGKMSCQRRISLIGGNSSPTPWVPVQSGVWVGGMGSAGGAVVQVADFVAVGLSPG